MSKKPQWQSLTFLDNFNAAATKMGYSNLPMAWGLANVRWNSVEDRDSFLDALTRVKLGSE